MIEERARSDKNYDKLTKENAGVLSTNHDQHNQILTLDLQVSNFILMNNIVSRATNLSYVF